MNYEHRKIQNALRKLMKKNKATYESVGRILKVSPATIKRRLNGNDMTIQQLKEFAGALSVSFYEVIELSKEMSREPHSFTEAQEELLASDLRLMKTFRMILAGQGFLKIMAQLHWPERGLRKAIRDLERVGLAQLLPGDRIIPMVQFPFRWQPNGRLERAYNGLILTNLTRRIAKDEGQAGLNKQFEFALSPDAYRSFCQEIESVYSKYRNLSEIHLSSQIDLEHTISGVLFLDQFSLWDPNNERELVREKK
jgi:transcriptional regulator with XRE-family HTH domain